MFKLVNWFSCLHFSASDRAFKSKSGNSILLLGFLQDTCQHPSLSPYHLSQPEARRQPCPSCSFTVAAVHSGPSWPQALQTLGCFPSSLQHIPAPGPLHDELLLGCIPPGSLRGWFVLISLQLEYSFIREALITLSKMSHAPITTSCFVVFRVYTTICYLLISSLIHCLLCWNESNHVLFSVSSSVL